VWTRLRQIYHHGAPGLAYPIIVREELSTGGFLSDRWPCAWVAWDDARHPLPAVNTQAASDRRHDLFKKAYASLRRLRTLEAAGSRARIASEHLPKRVMIHEPVKCPDRQVRWHGKVSRILASA
jgi:hypothetical protein